MLLDIKTSQLELTYLRGTPIFVLPLEYASHAGVRSVFGATHLKSVNTWCFPAFYPVHELVVNDLKKALPNLVLSEAVLNHIVNESKLKEIPETYEYITKPFDHQVEGLTHVYRNLRAGLFYSPGLGKTKITVDLFKLTNVPMLILCPKVMVHDWALEFVKHGGISDTVELVGTKKQKEQILEGAKKKPFAAVITTYETATRYTDQLIELDYGTIVADESHRLKTPFSQRTKASQALANKAHRRVLLSGTPTLGSPFDMYGQLRFLGHYFCPEDWWTFKKRFGVYADQDNKILIGFKNLEIINNRTNRICVKKTKDECLDLPDRMVIDQKFDLSVEQKKMYNTMIERGADEEGAKLEEAFLEQPESFKNVTTTPLHVRCASHDVLNVLNKVNQVTSGFQYASTQNPFICQMCERSQHCVDKGIQPYTKECAVVQVKPPVGVKNYENARMETLLDILDTLLEDASNKVIIWTNYTQEIVEIKEALKMRDIKHVVVVGGMSVKDLDEAKTKFNTDPKTQVYLAQVSTGIGVTLNAANYMIYYSLPWSLEHYEQSMDRNYRIGQMRKTTIYRLIGKNTLDEDKVRALSSKIDLSNLISTRAPCAVCPDYVSRCAPAGIKLYEDGCKFVRTFVKPTSLVRKIESNEGKNSTKPRRDSRHPV